MADLEDTILKKNIPGRYSTWSDNNDDGGKFHIVNNGNDSTNDECSDSEDDEYYYQDLPPIHPQPHTQPSSSTSAMAPPPKLSGSGSLGGSTSGNTGVKGVIADYHQARLEAQYREAEDRLERMEILHRATHPAYRPNENSNENNISNSNGTHNNDEDNEDDEDEDFLTKFRTTRLHQLRQASTHPTFSAPYSTLTPLTPTQYVSLVDSIDSRVYVLVHLHDPTSKESRMMHCTLEKLAQCMGYARFVEVDYEETVRVLEEGREGGGGLQWSRGCLPVVLVYRGGELVESLFRLGVGGKNGRDGIGIEEVKEALEGVGVLDPRSAEYHTHGR